MESASCTTVVPSPSHTGAHYFPPCDCSTASEHHEHRCSNIDQNLQKVSQSSRRGARPVATIDFGSLHEGVSSTCALGIPTFVYYFLGTLWYCKTHLYTIANNFLRANTRTRSNYIVCQMLGKRATTAPLYEYSLHFLAFFEKDSRHEEDEHFDIQREKGVIKKRSIPPAAGVPVKEENVASCGGCI